MELKVNEIQIPEVITFNYEQLKGELQETLKRYEGLVYTGEQMKAAKADRAALNKLKKALNDERIRRERDYMLPFLEFKKRINELIDLIDKPAALIDSQVKAYEEQKKEEKRKEIESAFKTIDFPEWLNLEKVFRPQWLNASVSMKAVEVELGEIYAGICRDLATLAEMPSFAFEAGEVYKQTLNVQTAIQEGKRLAEIQRRKEEAAAAAKAVQSEASAVDLRPAEEITSEAQEVDEEPKQWVVLRCYLSYTQACALRDFCKENGIEFKKV